MDRVKNKTGFDSVKTVLQKEAAEIQKLADHLNQDDVNQMLLLDRKSTRLNSSHSH